MLTRFLQVWLGAWPPPGAGITVVGHPARDKPRWDGAEQLALGVTDADGRGVLSVPPAPRRDAVAALIAGLDAVAAAEVLAARLPALLQRPEQVCFTGVFRWSQSPAALPDAGAWEPSDGPGIPDWLRPFPGDVLIARDPDGGYLAGVGLKPHDVSGIEISVGTDERARGQGLARRLVARAARRIVAGGAVAVYLHDPANTASARVADAAGFPDLGWKIHAMAGA
ncbi:GNAT family N-acetyltransferase [Dactylosporangium sp. NBC_01737]|uniref:GNAT family N-acetyltransferase n=1 Tax=Dactylosporangium sp. NBC_01737 TaxID=2975959 RepID=UPI002E0FEB57|nr:GNAT family N-acetyltransferase [Dactylosporangium sp. NBC_01737]